MTNQLTRIGDLLRMKEIFRPLVASSCWAGGQSINTEITLTNFDALNDWLDSAGSVVSSDLVEWVLERQAWRFPTRKYRSRGNFCCWLTTDQSLNPSKTFASNGCLTVRLHLHHSNHISIDTHHHWCEASLNQSAIQLHIQAPNDIDYPHREKRIFKHKMTVITSESSFK